MLPSLRQRKDNECTFQEENIILKINMSSCSLLLVRWCWIEFITMSNGTTGDAHKRYKILAICIIQSWRANYQKTMYLPTTELSSPNRCAAVKKSLSGCFPFLSVALFYSRHDNILYVSIFAQNNNNSQNSYSIETEKDTNTIKVKWKATGEHNHNNKNVDFYVDYTWQEVVL